MERIEHTFIEDEMEQSYINYAMSVIRGRAIPDVRGARWIEAGAAAYPVRDARAWRHQ